MDQERQGNKTPDKIEISIRNLYLPTPFVTKVAMVLERDRKHANRRRHCIVRNQEKHFFFKYFFFLSKSVLVKKFHDSQCVLCCVNSNILQNAISQSSPLLFLFNPGTHGALICWAAVCSFW